MFRQTFKAASPKYRRNKQDAPKGKICLHKFIKHPPPKGKRQFQRKLVCVHMLKLS